MFVTVSPNGLQRSVQIAKETNLNVRIYQLVNYKREKYWRLSPGANLPGAFENQFHRSFNKALETVAKLYLDYVESRKK